jgi:UDP-GlcNAc:undecaprenyl-phosphate GlcNAc-1-phosphate transferase
MSLGHYILLFALACTVTAITTPLIRNFCIKRDIVVPPGDRKIHTHPIPEMGGAALFLGIVVTIMVQLAGERFWGWIGFHTDTTITPTMLAGVIVGTGIIYITGVIDDVFDIPPLAKLSGQIGAGLVVALCGVQITYISNPFHPALIRFGVFSIPLTVIYFVAFANIINLIDGMDGLAAGISGIAAVSLAVIAGHQYQIGAAIIAVTIVGACLGFLRYNYPPASIFMGDQGALMLGFLLGAVSLLGVLKTTFTLSFAVPLLVLAVPIFDTFSAIVRRVRGKRPIGEADKSHMHHRLIGRGYSQRKTLLMVYAWSILLAIGGYFIQDTTPFIRLMVVVAFFIVTGILTYFLGLFEVAHHHDE